MSKMSIWKILNFIQLFGWPSIFGVIFIYIFIVNPEKGDRFLSFVSKWFSKFSKSAEKVAVAKGIQNKINNFVKTINSEVEDLLPYKLKIKWINESIGKDSFIRNRKVVIILKYHQNQDENLSLATLFYMKESIIPEAKPHISNKLSKSIDLMMTKKALYSFVDARSSFGYFVREILRKETEKNDEIKLFCSVIEELDSRGLFTRVLLRELKELGYKRAGITEIGDTVVETEKFTKFLDRIARKEQEEDVPLTFNGRYIKISIILVARPGNSELDSFIKIVKKKIKENVSIIYIFARGSNIPLAQNVCRICKNLSDLSLIYEETDFTTRIDERFVNGYYAIFYNRKIL